MKLQPFVWLRILRRRILAQVRATLIKRPTGESQRLKLSTPLPGKPCFPPLLLGVVAAKEIKEPQQIVRRTSTWDSGFVRETFSQPMMFHRRWLGRKYWNNTSAFNSFAITTFRTPQTWLGSPIKALRQCLQLVVYHIVKQG